MISMSHDNALNWSLRPTRALYRANASHAARLRRWGAACVALLLTWQSCMAQVPGEVARLMSAAGLPPETLAYVALRADSGEVVASRSPTRPMQPASSIKLLTAAVALDRLGLAWRSRSELVTDGELNGSVLRGNVLLRGYGDSDLDAEALRRMLQKLRDSGVREITGDVVMVRNWFFPARTDLGVAPFDETPEFRYNAIPDAIFLNSNLLQIDLIADAASVRLRSTPPLPGVTLDGHFTIVERSCEDWEDGWQLPVTTRSTTGEISVRLGGEFPKDCIASTQINVLDRTDYADRLFRSQWRELGGSFTGIVREGEGAGVTGKLRPLAEHRSRPLSEVLRDINKRSDNPITRLTFLALADRAAPERVALPTAVNAGMTVRQWLRDHHIDDTGLILDNGSGLSRSERISPLQLAQVVRAAARKPWAPEFMASMPVAGIDGGMQRRLNAPGLAGRARLKTGTLRNATALAGYLPDQDGNLLVVAAMLNGDNAKSKVARPILDALMLALANGHGRHRRDSEVQGAGR